ncbi:MAG TPA: GAF domain-containing protein [Herpetosiphonaceae bacterium]
MLKPVLPLADVRASAPNVTLSDVVEGILDVVARLLHTRLAVVARIESTTYTVMSVVDQHHTLRAGQIYPLHDTFCMHMLEQGQPLCISDITQAPMPFRFLPNRLELNIRSYIGVPLSMADGRVFGSLWAADPSVRLFSEQDVAMLQLFARLLRHELDQDAQTRHLERIEQVQSMHDSIDQVTGLLARDSLEAALAKEDSRWSRHGNFYAVAVLSIIQPESAQDAADTQRSATLRQGLADILMRSSRLVDYCARIDADEFAVLFADTSAEGVAVWRARIEAAIEAWNRVHLARRLALNVGIGIADCYDTAEQDQHSATVLELAQQRMYQECMQRSGQQPAL